MRQLLKFTKINGLQLCRPFSLYCIISVVMKVFEEFDFEEEMPKSPNEDVLLKLLERAQKNEHGKWEFIRSLEELNAVFTFRRAIRKIVTGFKRSTLQLLKTYKKEVRTHSPNLDVLLAAEEMANAFEFYKKEIEIAEDMIDEYKAYTCSGHILDVALNTYRPTEDLYDFRKPKPNV